MGHGKVSLQWRIYLFRSHGERSLGWIVCLLSLLLISTGSCPRGDGVRWCAISWPKARLSNACGGGVG